MHPIAPCGRSRKEYLAIFPPVRSFLLQPYPFSENAGKKLAVCGGVGLFITVFLIVFEPFGFDSLPVATQWLHALLFGAVTFAVSAFFQILLPQIFPSPFREERWRSWKEILYLLLTTAFIGAGNFVLMRVLYPSETTLAGFLQAQLITFEVGVFPVLFVVFLKQLTLYRRYAAEAQTVTQDIRHSEPTVPPDGPLPAAAKIILRGDNQNEELALVPDDLLFLSSADNYVNVRYREHGNEKSSLLRGSLKKFEEQLSERSTFFRCHRMYIVNLQAVANVSGNAQGLKLHLAGTDEAIPVSRSLTETVKERLHALSRSPQMI